MNRLLRNKRVVRHYGIPTYGLEEKKEKEKEKEKEKRRKGEERGGGGEGEGEEKKEEEEDNEVDEKVTGVKEGRSGS